MNINSGRNFEDFLLLDAKICSFSKHPVDNISPLDNKINYGT